MGKIDICKFCQNYPPSSMGGKPCSICPAEGKDTNELTDTERDEIIKQINHPKKEGDHGLKKTF